MTSEPHAVSPAATAFHFLLFSAVLVAFLVWTISILANSVATEALSFVLHGGKFEALLTCSFEAFGWTGVPVDWSQISLVSVHKAS